MNLKIICFSAVDPWFISTPEEMSEELIREYEERDEEESGSSGSEDENTNRNTNRDRLVELSDTEETKKSDDEKDDKDKDKSKDKPEKRRSLRPRVTLNDRILKNPKKGITKIETYFENFQFHGKGHEKEDLDRVMKRMEHWSHRLFPMYDFDDFLEKTEQIGMKRLMSAYVEKYRTDMLEDDIVIDDQEEDEPVPEPARDQFDDLFAEHAPIRRQMSQAPKVTLSDEAKERMERNRLLALEKKKAREAERQKQAEEADRLRDSESQEINNVGQDPNPVPVQREEMTMEERIEMKRQMALAKKLAKQKEMEKKAAEELVVETIQNKGDEGLNRVEGDFNLESERDEIVQGTEEKMVEEKMVESEQGKEDENVEEEMIEKEQDKDQKVEEEKTESEEVKDQNADVEEKIESMEVTEEDGSSEKMDIWKIVIEYFKLALFPCDEYEYF